MPAHQSVLLDAAVRGLALRPDGCYVDGTFGRGGHSRLILDQLGPEGRLLAIDKDPAACAHAADMFGADPRFSIHRGSFADLNVVLGEQGLLGKLNGILLDLGVSSPQLDEAERGFSFQQDGPLDMRMDPQQGESVADWLATADAESIARVLWRYGEERFSRRIAQAIVERRAEKPLTRTKALADLIRDVIPAATQGRIHPATRSFQALRIFINKELEDLEAVLPQSLNALAFGGRLAVISFHSLEDRMVKRFMRDQARPKQPELPMAPEVPAALKLCGKAQRAGEAEVAANPRARSAVLRVAERTVAPPIEVRP
ncbi:MAG: 16S rRNA (cytosine(1402)-N(4))-methyltransferase RsmH [Salinisphaeraceae bacterium]|nr:16S rRNA (cytosine(1402)-N(4))-methyltransferase RsmH [Salinisphaeraceae bacterium]